MMTKCPECGGWMTHVPCEFGYSFIFQCISCGYKPQTYNSNKTDIDPNYSPFQNGMTQVEYFGISGDKE